MIRRPMVSPDDSLELLLDTICNTFATVIFISMLASILAQNSAPAAASATETKAAVDETYARQRELSELQRRQKALQSQLTQQSDLIDRFSSEESVALAMQIHQDSESQSRMSVQKVETADAIVRSERDSLQLEQAVQELLKQQQDEQTRQTAKVSKNFVVRLFVAKDSFAEFLPVKEALTELGLEYALEIMPGQDVELVLTDKTQDRTYVQ